MFAVISAILAVGVSCSSLRAGKGVSAQLCDIENEGTRKFLEEVDYTSDTAYVTSFARTNKRLRNYRATEDETHILYELISHIRKFGDPSTDSINQLVENWATTRHSDSVDPLTKQEIAQLRQLLLTK